MRSSLRAKVAVGILLLAVGLVFISGNTSQAYAYPQHHHYHYNYCYDYYYYYDCSYYYYYYVPYYGYYYSYPYYYNGYGYSNYYNQPSQYQLTVTTDPSSLSSAVTGAGSYNQGSSASFSSQNIIQISKDTRYVFSHWSGDYSSTNPSGTITMDASKTVTAAYQLQYYLSVSVQPPNAPSPQGSGWYNAGDTVALTAPTQTAGGESGTRLVFNGWSVDGSNSQVGPSLSLPMNAPHMVVAQYTQQYYLTVSTDQGVPSGQGWYDAGTNAQISVSTPVSSSYGVSIIFNGWQGDVQSASQSTTVLMNGPKTVTATWRTDATLLYATVAAIVVAIAVVAGIGLYLIAPRRKGTAPAGQDTVMQTSSQRMSAICNNCGKRLPLNSAFCNSCGTKQP